MTKLFSVLDSPARGSYKEPVLGVVVIGKGPHKIAAQRGHCLRCQTLKALPVGSQGKLGFQPAEFPCVMGLISVQIVNLEGYPAGGAANKNFKFSSGGYLG